MRHFESNEVYQKLNASVSTELFKARIYQTAALALYDVVFSLQQFLSHRPKIGLVRGGTDLLEAVIPQFLRVQTPIQFKPESENILQFLEGIDKETNFVVWTAENEITGEIIFSESQCVEIHAALSKKRIFSVQIVNCGRQLNTIELLKNQYAILIEVPGIFKLKPTLVKYTDKFKAPSLIGAFQYLPQGTPVGSESLSVPTQFTDVFAQYDYFSHFAQAPERITDRQVFLFKKISGLALQQKLSLDLNLTFAPSALPSWVLDNWKNWWPEASQAQFLRGLLVISNDVLQKDPQLPQKMIQAIQELESMSEWSF